LTRVARAGSSIIRILLTLPVFIRIILAMESHDGYTSFAGSRLLASGDLATMLSGTKAYLDAKGGETVLIFHDGSGDQVDFDFRGTADEVVSRAVPPSPPRGPGRPKLGVVGGEVSLLPRHWEWLERQPQKASGTIRRLVEAAMRSGEEARRRRVEAADRFMTAMAGNLPGYEEASRALYAGDRGRLEGLVSPWPRDIGAYVLRLAGPLSPPGGAGTGSA
jgi:uncharacterized protein